MAATINCIYFGVQDSWTFAGTHWRVWDSSLCLQWLSWPSSPAMPQPREDDVLTQMDFALFGGALSLLGQHSHLLDYSPKHPRECQAALWKTSKAVRQVWNPRGSQEGEQGTEQPWADAQHFVLIVGSGHRTALAGWAKALQESPRTAQEHHLRLLPSRNPKMQLKLTTCGCTFFSVWAENASFLLPSASLRCWHSAAGTWSNQCSYGEVCLAWEMILLNRSIKFVSVFADNFHEYITLKYGTSILTYSLWCSEWLGKNLL